MAANNPKRTTPHHARNRLIYLTGFMGSGKSTVGPILANTLGFEFLDIDKLIERKADKPIVQLFDTVGEKGFRSLERETLHEVADLDGYVVSLGGGTLVSEDNFQVIQQSGIIVYLQLSPEAILQRVKHRQDRPMLKDPHGNPLPSQELPKRIEELLGRREQFYGRADIVVPTDNKKVGPTVDAIVQRLRALRTRHPGDV
jgi:shikimate kinase